jgi:hypothetical protein
VLGTRKRALVPGRWQSVAEMSYEFVADMVETNAGHDGREFFPFVFTLFMFILFANFLGMIPYSYTVTSQIVVTFALAAVVFIGVTINRHRPARFPFSPALCAAGGPGGAVAAARADRALSRNPAIEEDEVGGGKSKSRRWGDDDLGAAPVAESTTAPKVCETALYRTSLQATQCRGRNSRSSGRTCLHRSTAIGQRGWKTQPAGGLIGLGTSPLTGRNVRSASTLGSGTGTAASNAWV